MLKPGPNNRLSTYWFRPYPDGRPSGEKIRIIDFCLQNVLEAAAGHLGLPLAELSLDAPRLAPSNRAAYLGVVEVAHRSHPTDKMVGLIEFDVD